MSEAYQKYLDEEASYSESLLEQDPDSCIYDDCPKCGRTYNEIDRGYQICSKCGWDTGANNYGAASEPSEADYMMGEADILTGRWW